MLASLEDGDELTLIGENETGDWYAGMLDDGTEVWLAETSYVEVTPSCDLEVLEPSNPQYATPTPEPAMIAEPQSSGDQLGVGGGSETAAMPEPPAQPEQPAQEAPVEESAPQQEQTIPQEPVQEEREDTPVALQCPEGTSAVAGGCVGDAAGGAPIWPDGWTIDCDGYMDGNAIVCWAYTIYPPGTRPGNNFFRQPPSEEVATSVPADVACPSFGGGSSTPTGDGGCAHTWDGTVYTGTIPEGWSIECDNAQNPDGTYSCGSWTLRP